MIVELKRIRYTLLFIRYGDQILLLNRNSAPNKGLWNGVGGKLEPGETPVEGILREAWEETGIRLQEVRSGGAVTWADEEKQGGMYVFIAELPEPYPRMEHPIAVDEGILCWKPVSWILSTERNPGVGPLIPHYLPYLLEGEARYEHHFTFRDGQMVHYTRSIWEGSNQDGGEVQKCQV